MCIPAPAITCVRTHHAQYQKKTNESFWYCAWCLRTHVIAGAGRHFPVLLPPSTLHTRQKVLKTEQIWTSIRGWTKSKILVRKTTRRHLLLRRFSEGVTIKLETVICLKGRQVLRNHGRSHGRPLAKNQDSPSSRMHGEFLRLLFLQAHRETTAHWGSPCPLGAPRAFQ